MSGLFELLRFTTFRKPANDSPAFFVFSLCIGHKVFLEQRTTAWTTRNRTVRKTLSAAECFSTFELSAS